MMESQFSERLFKFSYNCALIKSYHKKGMIVNPDIPTTR